MKILKIIGIVTALNVLILLMILANPGCSSTSKANDASQSPAPSDSSGTSGITAAPTITYTPEASSTVVYSPTRPGTTAAAALVAQPVDVQAASTYTVARGDSVSSIAKKNHLSASDLAAANNLKSGAILRAGQKLIIPAKAGAPAAASQAPAAPVSEGTRHTVKPGETLGAIARKYGVRLGDIAAANNISDPKKIQPGQELIIPAKSAGHAAKTPKPKSQVSPTASQEEPAPEVKTVVVTPPQDQDLDSGLKPAVPGEVPVVKVDDNAGNNPPPKVP